MTIPEYCHACDEHVCLDDKTCICCNYSYHSNCSEDLTIEEYKKMKKDYPNFDDAIGMDDWDFPKREEYVDYHYYIKKYREEEEKYGACQKCIDRMDSAIIDLINLARCDICECDGNLKCNICEKLYCLSCVSFFEKNTNTKKCCISCCLRNKSFENKLRPIDS